MLKGRKSTLEIRIWQDKFQEKVDKITGKEYLQFTCETWNPGGSTSRNDTRTALMVMEKGFSLLDL